MTRYLISAGPVGSDNVFLIPACDKCGDVATSFARSVEERPDWNGHINATPIKDSLSCGCSRHPAKSHTHRYQFPLDFYEVREVF